MHDFATVVALATANGGNDGGGSGLGGLILPLLIVLVAIYFITVQRRRTRQAQQELARLKPGTLIMTRAGLYATVVEVDGQDVLLEVAPDVVCRFSKGAIGRVISSPPESESGEEGEAAGERAEQPEGGEPKAAAGEEPESGQDKPKKTL